VPTDFSDLLAPCESGAQGLISNLYTPKYHKAHKLSGAKKELKSGSLVPPLAAARSAAANEKISRSEAIGCIALIIVMAFRM
jgi:hypothetical protein